MSYIGLSMQESIYERYSGKWHTQTHNAYLKHAVLFYGLSNFSEEILEEKVSSIEKLKELESFYIEKYNSLYPNGYNFTTGGEHTLLSEETKRKISEKRAKEYDLVNFLGEEKHIKNLKKFCKENGYSYAAMKNMVQGQTLSSSGWALKGVNPIFIKNPNKKYKLESPDGSIVEFENINSFCKENSLKKFSIQKLLSGKRKVPHKGWKLPNMDLTKQKIHDKYKNHKFINPKGEVILVENVYKFANENPPLDRKDLYMLINKKTKERKGWKLYE